MKSRHISCVIHSTPAAVYEFACVPENLPRWAAGLVGADVQRKGDLLLVQSPMGQVTMRFVPRNEFGVLDHAVTLPSGTVVNNHLRVLAHPLGAEVVFTVRQVELTDEEFERDCRMVAEDLVRLKQATEH